VLRPNDEVLLPSIPAQRETRSPQAATSRAIIAALAFQRALLRNPRDASALAGISLLALSSGQLASALRAAAAATAAGPAMPAAWVALGQALKAARRYDDAERAMQQALRLAGTSPWARMALAELKLATGRPAEAIRDFEIALLHVPSLACAHLGLGNAHALTGSFARALTHYRNALALRPAYPEAHFASGFALARLGRAAEAEAHYRRAIFLNHDHAHAWINLGSLLREQGRDLAAEAALSRAIHLRPELVSGWINLAALRRERRQFDAARACIHRAFFIDPGQVETLIASCQLELAGRDVTGARAWIRWALAVDPGHAEAANMHGIILHNERRFAEAIAEFERAQALGSKSAASNRGNSLLELGLHSDALAAHQQGVDLDPANAGARYNLALTQLRLGQWREGWPGYESRWQFREVHRAPRKFHCPRWRGEPLAGRRILLHAEQGLGDTIQFARYASMVATRGGRPILQVQPAAERLLASLAAVRAGLAQVCSLDAPQPDHDLECPLMSLPAVFSTGLDTVPWGGPYLGADRGEIQSRLAQFPSRSPGPRIGVAWAGNPKYRADAQRSVHLRTLVPLFRAFRANWFSLQKGDAARQLAALRTGILITDGCSQERDLASTAALVATLHLVITTDTSIAHLAGAMGKPVWILLPRLADWRWMEDLETTPWYPTARLFRQSSAGDWPGVLTRVVAALSALDY